MDKLAMDNSSSDDGDVKNVKQVKAVVLGDGGVGKTCLCERFCKDFFASTYKQTLGLDFFSQTVQLPGKQEVTFNLFDIGGHSITSNLLPTYVSGADCLIYVFDLTDQNSLLNITQWAEHCKNVKNAHVVLVGNKADLANRRAVRQGQIDTIQQKINAKVSFSVSALTGDRVQMLFTAIAGAVTGIDVKQLMLDTRNVVAAGISQQDIATAAEMNRDGNIITDEQKELQNTQYTKTVSCSLRNQMENALSDFWRDEEIPQQQKPAVINSKFQQQNEVEAKVQNVKSGKKRKSMCKAM